MKCPITKIKKIPKENKGKAIWMKNEFKKINLIIKKQNVKKENQENIQDQMNNQQNMSTEILPSFKLIRYKRNVKEENQIRKRENLKQDAPMKMKELNNLTDRRKPDITQEKVNTCLESKQGQKGKVHPTRQHV